MVFPSINLLFWSVLTPHVSVIIESMLNQAWSPGYLSIFLSKHFPLWPVSGPHTKYQNFQFLIMNFISIHYNVCHVIVSQSS